jgi:hypothetical protein
LVADELRPAAKFLRKAKALSIWNKPDQIAFRDSRLVQGGRPVLINTWYQLEACVWHLSASRW